MLESHQIRTLERSEVEALSYGDLVYVSRKGKAGYEPAMVSKLAIPGVVHLVMCWDIASKDVTLPYATYGTEYHLGVQNGLFVATPGGTIHVFDKRDRDYPGVWIEVYSGECSKPSTVAMVEHIPGGEGLCSYTPANHDAMEKEFREVPKDRIINQNTGRHIAETDYRELTEGTAALTGCEYTVSPGFVTRAWQKPDSDDHSRTFHVGV